MASYAASQLTLATRAWRRRNRPRGDRVRALVGLAVTMVAVLALAGPASAASGQVTHFRFHGSFADAAWFTSSATSFTNTSVSVSKSRQGSSLFVDQLSGNLDASGNFTGGTDTSALVTSGFSFTIDATKLTRASTSGLGLPATTCTLDANGNPVGPCTDTTVDVNVTWIGQGPIGRQTSTSHFKADGFSVTFHTSGTDRAATATGTVGGLAMGDSQFADLGNANQGETDLCIGNSC
jgi:hypothetical protein